MPTGIFHRTNNPSSRTRADLSKILVDKDDKHLLTDHLWYVMKTGYLCAIAGSKSDGTSTTVLLHRLVMKAPKGKQVDHISGDKMDNRKSNLRIVTQYLNQQNRHGAQKNSKSGIRGVVWGTSSKKWEVYANKKGKTLYLGSFESKRKAAKISKEWRVNNMPGYIDHGVVV